MNKYRSYDIYIVGLGILGMLQITRETEQALSLCNEIFYLHTFPQHRPVSTLHKLSFSLL